MMKRTLRLAVVAVAAITCSCSNGGDSAAGPANTRTTAAATATTAAAVEGAWRRADVPAFVATAESEGEWFGVEESGAVWRAEGAAEWTRLTAISGTVNDLFEHDGLLIAGGSSRDHPSIWSSEDEGASWEAQPLAGAGAVTSLAATETGWLAVGSTESYGPQVFWTAGDGRDWHAVEPEASGFREDWNIWRLVAFDGRFVGFGSDGDLGAAMFTSDLGRVWTLEVVAEFESATGLKAAAVADGVLAVAGLDAPDAFAPGVVTVWTTRDLESWTTTTGDAEVFGDQPNGYGIRDLITWNDGFAALATIHERSDVQFCFQEISTCKTSREALLVSPDGEAWSRTTLSTEPYTQALSVAEASGDDMFRPAANPAGYFDRLLAGPTPIVYSGSSDRDTFAWVLTDERGGAVTAAPIDNSPSPTTTTPPLPALDQEPAPLEVGDVWRFEFHQASFPCCIFDSGPSGVFECVLPDFNGRSWELIEDFAPDPWPESWPVRIFIGTDTYDAWVYTNLELVDPDRIELTIDQELIWAFGPTAGPPLDCGGRGGWG